MDNILKTTAGFDTSHLLALINAVGGRDNALGLCNGTKKATVEDVIRFFDKHVRFMIPQGFKFDHIAFNPNYAWEQPTAKFDFDALVKRGGLYLPKGVKLPSASQIEDGCRALEEEVSADDQVSKLFKVKDPRRGIRLPWFLPQMEIDIRNVGKVIHEIFKPAIKAAYEQQFEGRNFVDYRKNETDGRVAIVDESQLRLVSALREGPVFGWIFPAVFQGIGIEGDRALMKTLPKKHNGFVLGGFDFLAAMILHTPILARDGTTPVMDLASFQWCGPKYSLCVGARDSNLGFGHRDLSPHENYSAALSVFRQ